MFLELHPELIFGSRSFWDVIHDACNRSAKLKNCFKSTKVSITPYFELECGPQTFLIESPEKQSGAAAKETIRKVLEGRLRDSLIR